MRDQYADQIRDPGLRETSYAVVDLGDRMLATWRQTIRGQSPQEADGSPVSQNFQRAYTGSATQSRQAGQAPQAACPA